MVSIYSTHGAAVVHHGFSHLPVQPYLDCRPLPIQITRALTGLTERLVWCPGCRHREYRATLRLRAAYVMCGLDLPKLCL